MAVVRVAVAVILVGKQVLLAKRPLDKNQGGLWEFPGGKIEANESPEDALIRELKEEVGVDFSAASIQSLITLPFTYPEIQVQLEVFTLMANVSALTTAYGAEGQEVRWVNLLELSAYEFPEANQEIIAALQNLAQ